MSFSTPGRTACASFSPIKSYLFLFVLQKGNTHVATQSNLVHILAYYLGIKRRSQNSAATIDCLQHLVYARRFSLLRDDRKTLIIS